MDTKASSIRAQIMIVQITWNTVSSMVNYSLQARPTRTLHSEPLQLNLNHALLDSFALHLPVMGVNNYC